MRLFTSRHLALIFVLLGLVCLLTAQLLGPSSVIGGALVNLGVTFIAIIMLDLLWTTVGGEPLRIAVDKLEGEVQALGHFFELVRDSESSGVRRIVGRSDEFATGSDWQRLLSDAREQVDLCGTAQHGWLKDAEGFKKAILNGLPRGCQYRLLLYAPMSQSSPPIHPIRQIIETERTRSVVTSSNNIESLAFFLSVKESLPDEYRNQFRVHVVDDKVLYNIISRFDNTLLVTQYLYHARSESCPLLEIKGPGTALFETFTTEFELLWREKSRSISSVELDESASNGS